MNKHETYARGVLDKLPKHEHRPFVEWVSRSQARIRTFEEQPVFILVQWLGSAEHYRLAGEGPG